MNEEIKGHVLHTLMGGVLSQSIAVVAELGIADLLVGGPKSAEELAAQVGAQPAKLHRVLRYTASHGVFHLNDDGTFGMTPMADVLRSDSPFSVRAAGRMYNRDSRAFPFLIENITTGKCAYEYAFGKSIFEDLAEHPADAAIFDTAMFSFHGGETDAVLNAYSFDGVGSMCDVGSGSGVMMAATLKRYPSMQGVLFDLGHVMERTKANMDAAGVTDRCRFEVGSFFEAVPAGCDVYAVRHIIHDWQDAESVQILATIRAAMSPGSKLLILEAVVPAGNEPGFAKMADITMMVWPNGLERTEAEYQALLVAAGFDLVSVTPTYSPVSVIEAKPRA